MTETLVYGNLSNEYQHGRILDGFQITLRSCALDESSLRIEWVKVSFASMQYCSLAFEGLVFQAVSFDEFFDSAPYV